MHETSFIISKLSTIECLVVIGGLMQSRVMDALHGVLKSN